jgi:hypothetical protein
MWAWKNPNVWFYYQESGSKIGGELLGNYIPFTIGIQTT